MSCRITSVNSLSPSPMAPASASFRSCARRASDSIIRSSARSCAHLVAVVWSIVGSNAVTLAGTVTRGIEGSTHTLAEAAVEGVPGAGGRAAAADATVQDATSVLLAPIVSDSTGREPSGSSGAGTVLCSESSADSGSAVSSRRESPSAAGARTPSRRSASSHGPPSSSGATSRAIHQRPAHVKTRLARIAVLVQNSSTVGPMSTTDRKAVRTPKTTRAA